MKGVCGHGAEAAKLAKKIDANFKELMEVRREQFDTRRLDI